jgi:hypothetical protein
MTRRKIENAKTSKYKNKKLLKFTKRKANTPLFPLAKLNTFFFWKIHKMTRRKLKTLPHAQKEK